MNSFLKYCWKNTAPVKTGVDLTTLGAQVESDKGEGLLIAQRYDVPRIPAPLKYDPAWAESIEARLDALEEKINDR